MIVWGMDLIWLIPICVGAYFIGNVNLAVILSKRFLRKDIRGLGSGNAGTTNMLRNFGFKWAIVVFLYDILKGVIPVLIMRLLVGEIAMYAVGLAVVVGHCFPILSRFRGGKGVATLMGAFLVIAPAVTAIAFAIGLLYIMIFEYGAVSSLIFITIIVLWQSVHTTNLTVHLLLVAFYLLVLFTHRGNILRLLRGRENKARLIKRIRKKFQKPKPAKIQIQSSSQ